MERERFIRLVRRALREIPAPFKQHLKNIDIIVKRRPSAGELRDAGLAPDESMYGFYHGVPMTERGSDYGMTAPDVIYIYQEPLEEDFSNDRELVEEIRTTVLHEVGHFFGIDDERLEELGRG
ncbi:MAG TPA: metallopeptidase family protein [Dehalococcoidia bacterium]|nr:metallopeptidase family protein [Dehalococcoidia bacterium]